MNPPHYIFGFASLVNLDSLHFTLKRDDPSSLNYQYCNLLDYARIWNVGMDNSIHIKDYKHYVDPETGERPDIFVTFLNVQKSSGSKVKGIVYEVTPKELQYFDQRERNYSRLDVTKALDVAMQGTAWVYIGLPESIRRFEAAHKDGRAVISDSYRDVVISAYNSLDENALKEYEQSTINPGLSRKKLKLIRH